MQYVCIFANIFEVLVSKRPQIGAQEGLAAASAPAEDEDEAGGQGGGASAAEGRDPRADEETNRCPRSVPKHPAGGRMALIL